MPTRGDNGLTFKKNEGGTGRHKALHRKMPQVRTLRVLLGLLALRSQARVISTYNESSTILISYFSASGWTKALAEEVATGA